MKKIILYILFLIIFFAFPLHAFTEEVENENEIIEKAKDIYLDDIIIPGFTYTPVFEKMNNLYSLEINQELENLDVTCVAAMDDVCEVSGNKNMLVGKNIVTIKVTNQDGTKENIYQLTVNINDIDEESLTTGIFDYGDATGEVEEINSNTALFIAGTCLLLIFILFKIMFRKKKNVQKA